MANLTNIIGGQPYYDATNANSESLLSFWKGTQVQYDAIGTKDAQTLYLITAQMPINLFNNPLASIKLGANDILKGYIGNSPIFPNLITIEFTSISGLSLTYTLPPSQTGDPGTSYSSTTFTISGTTGQRLNASSFAMTNLPASLSATVTGGNNSQTLTVTITGTYPTVGVGAITSVVSGINISTEYLAHYLVVGGGSNTNYNYIHGGGGGGGLKTSFSTQGGGIAAASQLTLIPNTSYTVTVGQREYSSTFSSITATAGSPGNGSNSIGNSTDYGGTAGSYGYAGGQGATGGYAGGGGGAGSAGIGYGDNSGAPGGGIGGNGLQVLIKGGGSSPEYSHGGTGVSGNRGGLGTNPSSGQYGAGANVIQSVGAVGLGTQGIIIIRVPTASVGTASGTHTTGTTGTDTWIQWTGSGSYTA